MTEQAIPPVLVIMGVSGCGKTTIAQMLAAELHWEYAEGDAMHPQANVEKMASGHPLTDADRWPWLATIAEWIKGKTAAGEPGVITCSALKRSYREILRGDNVVFVYLKGSRELIARRLVERHGHFMPPGLLDSQFAALEEPGPDERAVTVDISAEPPQTEQAVLDALDGVVPGLRGVQS